MKKTIIGSVFMLSGLVNTLSLIIIAVLYAPNITTWRGSKLWFAIFAAEDIDQGLSVGVPFVIGLILLITGIIMLLVEYFNDQK